MSVLGSPDVIVAAVALLVSAIFAVPFLKLFWKRIFSGKQQQRQTDKVYEDEDGLATKESQQSHGDLTQRVILLVGSIFGIAVSILALIGTRLDRALRCSSHHVECPLKHDRIWLDQCMTLATWVIISIEALTIFRVRSTRHKFYLGGCTGITSFVLVIVVFAETLTWFSVKSWPPATSLHYGISLAHCILGLTVTLTALLIPRRPNVYKNGKLVDGQYTTSWLGRITFAWATPILGLAAQNRNLNISDLPMVSNDARSEPLLRRFEAVFKNDNIWMAVFLSNKKVFIMQWTLQFFQAFGLFLPSMALFFALRLLEARDAGEGNTLQLWLLMLVPGIADAVIMTLDSYLWFICYSKIQVPVYEQISAIVFAKSLRKKDTKGVASDPEKEDFNPSKDDVVESEHHADGEDDEGDTVAKTKQSTINLMGVDGSRIASFANYNCMFLGASMKILIALALLVRLLGWIPLLSGFAAFVALMPLNWWVTNRYTATQDLVMKVRDSKMAVVTEALQGIRQIKFSALEREWYDKIGKVRRRELSTQWRAFVYDVLLISVWIFGPICLSVISLAVYALINKQLNASVAFTTISIFEALDVTLAVVPELVSDYADAVVSTRRVQEYLNSPDREDAILPGDNISFEKASIAWPSDDSEPSDDQFKLHDVNLAFPKGELSVISGRTGSGKSLLLSAIIGEAEVLQGTITVPKAPPLSQRFDNKANKDNWIIESAVAYVAQIPWIENATIKENVLFALPYDAERYKQVLEASALMKDLEMLQDGDMTDIGANGINLSGGQKWRVSFARALYSRAGILVLDDVFSAVDAHVGKHLFEQALTGPIGQGRTRILVTHHVALCLPKTEYSVLLDNGTVLQAGPTEDLRRKGLLKDILVYDAEEQKDENAADNNEATAIDDGGGLQKMFSNRSAKSRRRSTLSDAGPDLRRTISHAPEDRNGTEPPRKFVQDENREIGAIKLSMYKTYFKASGGFRAWISIVLVFTVWTGIFISRSYWVSVWTRAYKTESTPTFRFMTGTQHAIETLRQEWNAVEVDRSLNFYLAVYVGIAVSSWLLGSFKYFMVYSSSIRASKVLFERLCHAVLRAPLRFLDTTPLGRILNRFTADFNLVDSRMAPDVGFALHSFVSSIAVIIAAAFVSPLILIAAFLLLIACLWFSLRYLTGAREVKRLESNAKSPVFEQFGSVLTGLGTIRAFGRSEAYVERMQAKIDTHCQAYFHLWLFNRWMNWRVGIVGSAFILAIGVLVVSIPHIDAPLAGFALSFSLSLSESIIWALRQYSNVELDMNAIERITEYSNMPMENQGGKDVPAAWPTRGEVEVQDLVVSYANDLSPVLKGLTFGVKEKERIGVVGRTGAGKSSLTLALFRFLEARSGSIHIDGIDISKIKLFDLRSRLAIIPQDPVLFSGTVRSNLDAFDQHQDSELRDALARVHLISSTSAGPSGTATPSQPTSVEGVVSDATSNANVFRSLNSKISEGGLNLSQGQRQLLCLARAIVARPKIMVLDEATSSVDMATDTLIQRSIREEFADSTLIVIAHRLSTIADFDRILVLGEGKVVEFDTPEELMSKPGGLFRSMVEDSGERRELEQIIRDRRK